jgi:hypothetical protein
MWLMYAKFVWIVYLTRNWNWANWNFKIQFWENKQMCFIVPHAWGTVKQMQPIFLSRIRSTVNLSCSTLYYFYEWKKSLLSLSVLRKLMFLCYTQDYNKKYIFRLTVPHLPYPKYKFSPYVLEFKSLVTMNNCLLFNQMPNGERKYNKNCRRVSTLIKTEHAEILFDWHLNVSCN